MQNQELSNQNRVVYVVDGARTPFIKAKGEPGPFSASDLAVQAGRTLLSDQNFAPTEFDEVIVGCVSPSEEEANIARVISLRLGCGHNTPAWTVQRNCASGLQALDAAFQSIQSGKNTLVLAGGTEAMSRTPLLFNQQMVKWLSRLNKSKQIPAKLKTLAQFRPQFLVPVIALLKGLTDPVVNLSMGQTAEELSYKFGINRKEMDTFAASSHTKALKAMTEEAFETIVPLFANNGKVFEVDDGVRNDSTVERLGKLRPVFDKYGNISAGNSSQVTDGSCMLILAGIEAVEKYNLPVKARIIDFNWAALDPSIMGLGPVHAMTPLLQKYQLKLEDIGHIEINEAFAAQVLACVRAWQNAEYCKKYLHTDQPVGDIDMDKLNPHGGAIALGHPVGASGARLVLHAAHSLQQSQNQYALVSLCIGGGQGGAALIERV